MRVHLPAEAFANCKLATRTCVGLHDQEHTRQVVQVVGPLATYSGECVFRLLEAVTREVALLLVVSESAYTPIEAEQSGVNL